MNTSYNNEKREQIPKEEGPEGRTGKVVSQQNASKDKERKSTWKAIRQYQN